MSRQTPSPRLSGCTPGPTALLAGVWPPLLQRFSQLLTSTLTQSFSSTSALPPLAVHLQGLLLPRAYCDLALGQPAVAFSPSPSPACQSPLEGTTLLRHAACFWGLPFCCPTASLVPLTLRFRDAASVQTTESLPGFIAFTASTS